MPRWTKARREDYARRAFEMDVAGLNISQIARNLEIDRKTVGPLLDEERERRRIFHEHERERSIHSLRAVQTAAWERYHRIPITDMRLLDPETGETIEVHSINRSDAGGLLNTIVRAQGEINDITGAKKPTRVEMGGPDGEPIRTEGTVHYIIDWDDVGEAVQENIISENGHEEH
jgi:hypothetical protein